MLPWKENLLDTKVLTVFDKPSPLIKKQAKNTAFGAKKKLF